MSVNVAPIIEQVISKQKNQNLSDKALAKQFGINRGLWHMLKTGQRRPTAKVLSAIVHSFPELSGEVLNYLLEGNFSQNGVEKNG
jgi:predicted transcriptional regulator